MIELRQCPFLLVLLRESVLQIPGLQVLHRVLTVQHWCCNQCNVVTETVEMERSCSHERVQQRTGQLEDVPQHPEETLEMVRSHRCADRQVVEMFSKEEFLTQMDELRTQDEMFKEINALRFQKSETHRYRCSD